MLDRLKPLLEAAFKVCLAGEPFYLQALQLFFHLPFTEAVGVFVDATIGPEGAMGRWWRGWAGLAISGGGGRVGMVHSGVGLQGGGSARLPGPALLRGTASAWFCIRLVLGEWRDRIRLAVAQVAHLCDESLSIDPAAVMVVLVSAIRLSGQSLLPPVVFELLQSYIVWRCHTLCARSSIVAVESVAAEWLLGEDVSDASLRVFFVVGKVNKGGSWGNCSSTSGDGGQCSVVSGGEWMNAL